MPNRAPGSSRPNAKLTNSIVITARNAYRYGMTIRELSTRYGVSANTMHAAVTGRTWSHVPGAIPKGYRKPWDWHKRA